jgi:menaquinone-dependent protoporphyrinogen oxidase
MKALVVYGTRWGGSEGIAKKIGAVLRQYGITVDILNAKNAIANAQYNICIDSYKLIVVGSGIRADKWTKDTLNFIEKNVEVLKTKKIALFVSCQMADRIEEEVRNKAKTTYLEKTAEKYDLKPISLGFFGGFLDFSKSHGLLVDFIVRINRKSLRKNGLDTTRIYDTRNWESIEEWTNELALATQINSKKVSA